MNNLLLFFALPVATVIISIALQKILRNPFLVAGVIFSIFLIITFVINDINFLVATIVYTIISFITAVITCFIHKILRNNSGNNLTEVVKTNMINMNDTVVDTNDKLVYDKNDYWATNGCNDFSNNQYVYKTQRIRNR